MSIFKYLHPDSWKYEAALYHICWWLIFTILTAHALMFPGAAVSVLTNKSHPMPLYWVLTLPILLFCIAVVYRYSKEKYRHAVEQGKAVVTHALALQEAQAQINYLLRIIHDLRSPITTILNALPLVERRQSPATYVQSIKSACYYAAGLVDKVFRETSVTELEKARPEPILLTGWLMSVQEMMKPAANQRGVFLKGGIDETLPDYVMGDREAMTRMLVNLLDNAIAYSPQNTDVKIACYGQLSDLIIQVTNMAATKVPANAFQPYVRGTSEGEGKGLGLAITRRLAETMGGSAYAEAVDEQGHTSFFIRIPLKEAEAPVPAAEPVLPPPAYNDCAVTIDTTGNGLHVMLIEDDDNLRAVLSDNLLSNGVATRVISTASGMQAVDTAMMMMPDIIITDDHLFGMDGVEVVQKLRQMERTKGIPVVIISGDDLIPFQKHQYAGLGVTEFIRKPFSINGLGRAIKRAVAP